MNRNWNLMKGVKVGNSINSNDEKMIKLDIKIKRIVNQEFKDIKFINNNPNLNNYFKWIKS